MIDETGPGSIFAQGSGEGNHGDEDNNKDKDNEDGDKDGDGESALHAGEAAAEDNIEEEINVIKRDPKDTCVHNGDVLVEENYAVL